MKRLPIIVLTLALCLLTAGCGAKPNEPADGDSAKAGIVERMATVKAEEIKYISSFFSREHVSAEDMASVLNAAAEHHSEQPGQGLDHYTMEIYLSGGPDAYSSSDEHFVFFAGLDENHINGIYFNGKGDSHRMSFEDETLYWLIRNGYRTEVQVDKDAYEYHQAILDQRAQRLAAQCASPSRTDLMGVSVPELYQYIEAAADSAVEGQWCFNQDLFDKAMEDFYSDMIEQELPDEILFFHLSRRLKGSENEISYNLQELLTSNNSFSEFLNAHQITFRKGAGNRIILCYRDRQISLENTMSTDVCYLRSRLGYNSGREDFCFNGFAFRDLLMKNQYTRQLQDCPEILERLESYLRIKGLAKEYAEKSEYYCFMYRFPIGCVIFDGKDDLTVEEKQLHLLNQVAYRLYQYSGDSRYLYDHDNPILRLKDDDNASVDCLVSTEIITSDMIE